MLLDHVTVKKVSFYLNFGESLMHSSYEIIGFIFKTKTKAQISMAMIWNI